MELGESGKGRCNTDALLSDDAGLESYVGGWEVGRLTKRVEVDVMDQYSSRFRKRIFLEETLISLFYPFSLLAYRRHDYHFWHNRMMLGGSNEGLVVSIFVRLPLLANAFLIMAAVEVYSAGNSEAVNAVCSLEAFLVLLVHAVHSAMLGLKYAFLEPVVYRRLCTRPMSIEERRPWSLINWVTTTPQTLVNEIGSTALSQGLSLLKDNFYFELSEYECERKALHDALVPPRQRDRIKFVDVESCMEGTRRVSGLAAALAIALEEQTPQAVVDGWKPVLWAAAASTVVGGYGWRVVTGTLSDVWGRGDSACVFDLVVLNMLFILAYVPYNAVILRYLMCGVCDYEHRARMVAHLDGLLVRRPCVSESDEYHTPVIDSRRALLKVETCVVPWVSLRVLLKGLSPQFLARVSAYAGLASAITVLTSVAYLLAVVLHEERVTSDLGYVVQLSYFLITGGVMTALTIVAASGVNDATDNAVAALTNECLTVIDEAPVMGERERRIEALVTHGVRALQTDDAMRPLRVLGFRADLAMLSSLGALVASAVVAFVQSAIGE